MFELSGGDVGVISYGFATLAFLGFAVHLAIGWRRGTKAAILLATVVASAVWAALHLSFLLSPAPELWRAQGVLDALRSGGWLLFLAILLQGNRFARRLAPLLALLPALAWLPYPPAPPQDYSTPVASSRPAFAVLLAVAVTGLVLIEQIFRRALEPVRWSIKPLCLGLGAGFIFDVYLFADALLFGRLDAGVWAARGFAQALAIPFIAVATARNRDWTIDIALSRSVVFHSSAFLACGIYLLTMAAAGYYLRYFGGSWGKTLQVGFIFTALVLLGWVLSSGTLRSKARVFMNKHFFSYRYDYRQEWLRFTNLLAARADANVSPAQRSIQALANLVESPAGALWLHDGEGRYTQAARCNMAVAPAHEAADGPLARFLASTGWVVDLHEWAREPSRYRALELPGWLRGLPSAWLVVPVIAQEELIGFVILATPRAAIELNWEVLDLLKTAARQVGSFLAQVQASEALLEARKFESFNKMSAFVVHDLKNLVAQLSLLLRNAERHRHNPRFQEDMFSTVTHVSERMSRLLLQLSTGSRGEENLRPIRLAAFVERIVAAKRLERHDIALQAAGEEVATLGYERRFERVIGHLLQNAIDATRDGGEVRVGVGAEGLHAVVEVADSGCGMSEEFVRHQMFRPFQSTKESGMGMGTYEAAQYVKEMKGRIEVDSRPGAGTRLKVMLPLHRGSKVEPVRQVA